MEELVERTIEIYDDSGLIEVKTIMVKKEPIESQIEQKEQQLLQMYEELQMLKQLKETNIPQ